MLPKSEEKIFAKESCVIRMIREIYILRSALGKYVVMCDLGIVPK